MENPILIYVGGEFKKTSKPLTVKNPYDGSVVAQTFLAEEADYERAAEAALQSAEAMKNLPAYRKYEILMNISHELSAQRERLAKILTAESGKPIRYALGEIDRAAQTFIEAAEESKRLPREYISIDRTESGKGKEGLVKYFPIGPVAGIAPFNFPLNLAVHKIAPAIAAGNPIVLKPASSTPLSVLELAKIIDKTSLPKGAFSVLPMNRTEGNRMVTDSRFKMLSFTGSPEVGWKMKNDAGKKRVVLELGGNAGVIVSDKSDIDIAVKKCVVGAFAYSGQVCIHVQRIYIHKNVFDIFVDKFTKAVNLLKFGNPENPETDVSVMIDETNAIRVETWVNEATALGAKILCGGHRNGTAFEPTVLTDTRREMKVCSLEVFGPVVNLEKCDSVEQAIDFINDSEFGLQAGIFSDSLKEINTAFGKLEVGGVIVNDVPTFRVDHMPYGGVKNSGFGREGVKYAILDMMEAKILVKEF
jgi:glyceraldehyde-3-phosphate dehydrogenase (NADP+)